MSTSYSQFLYALPATVLVTMCLFLLAILAGWVTSVIAGFRSARGKGLRFLLIFPLSNPIALLILGIRDRSTPWLPVICYGVAVLSLPVGGFVSERVEKQRLERHVRQLEQVGESVSIASLVSAPVPTEENVWGHPYLAPLARAGQHGPEGEAARASLGEDYGAMSMPSHRVSFRYTDDPAAGGAPRDKAYLDPFRAFHQNALSTEAGQDLVRNDQPPASWEECGALLLEHFEPAGPDFDALEDALARPLEHYPHEWENGFDLLLPHLAEMKGFTQCATWRSIASNSQGESEAAYRDVQIAMRLLRIGDSDLLISRLVQWAQCAITLNAVLVAQQYHAWNGDQWGELQAKLEALDFPAEVADSMRAERVLGHASIGPLLRQNPFEMRRLLGQLGAAPDEYATDETGPSRGVQALVNTFVGGLARAFLTSQWRLALEAMGNFIVALEAAETKSHSEAWKDLRVAEQPIEEYGYLARMLMPALDKAFDKSIDLQTQVRLAVVGCALERYFLAQGRYPESIDELSPEYLASPSLDPMTRQTWFYDRTGDRALRVYSAGRNGIDDQGLYTRGGNRGTDPRKDDFAWIITEQLPSMPEIVVDRPQVQFEGGPQLPPEVMRRYGLTPSNPTEPVSVTNRSNAARSDLIGRDSAPAGP